MKQGYLNFKTANPLSASLLFVFFIFHTGYSYGKQPGNNGLADSLRNELSYHLSSATRFEVLLSLSNIYQEENPDSGYRYGTMALYLAATDKNEQNSIRALNSLTDGFLFFGRKDSARKYLNAIEAISKKSKDEKVITGALNAISSFYSHIDQPDSALIYLYQQKQIADASPDNQLKASAAGALGAFFIDRKNFDGAIPYCQEAIKYQKNVDSSKLVSLFSNLGNVYFWKQRYDSALKYYYKAYRLAESTHSRADMGYASNNLGLVYGEINDFDHALLFFKSALKQYHQLNNHKGAATSTGNIAEVYYLSARYDSAIFYARLALNEALAIHDLRHVKNNYELLTDIYHKKKDFEKAFETLQFAKAYSDSLDDEDMKNKIAGLNVRYGIAKQELENKNLMEVRQQQDTRIQRQIELGVIIIILLFFSIIISFILYRSRVRLKSLNKKIKKQNDQLEKDSQFKIKLFSIVSHDFKSPLSTLKQYMYLMENQLLDEKEMTDVTLEMGRQLKITTDFADNLLKWSRSQLDGYHPEIRENDLQEMVSEIFALYGKQAESKNIVLDNAAEPGSTIIADPDFIRLVLRNLVSNAIKFTENGTVSVHCINNDAEKIVSVKDSGVGMSPEEKELLFKGKQYRKQGTANESGSGLGLILCREFIHTNGGKLWVETQPGQGSTFFFTVPQATSLN